MQEADMDDLTVNHQHMAIYLASCIDWSNITVTKFTKKIEEK